MAMFDLEIETLLLRLPGVSRERAEITAEQVGNTLRERLSQSVSPPTGHIERMRIRLEAGVGEDEASLVDRIVHAIAKELRLR
jgi:hypothetical protein